MFNRFYMVVAAPLLAPSRQDGQMHECVVSTKDRFTRLAGLILNPHSAQNPLYMDNDWMHANLGNHEICRKHGQLWHQSVCGTFGNTNVSNGTHGKHTQLQMSSQLYGLI